MSAESLPFVFCGSRCLTVSALVDTGSDRSVIPSWLAQQLGIAPGPAQLVDTNGGQVVMYRAQARIALPNQPAIEVSVWISDGGVRTSLGANALRDLGFQLVPPDPINSDVLQQEGIPVPDTDGYVDGAVNPGAVSAAATAQDFSTASRLAICAGCSNAKQLPLLGTQCTLCGCLMNVKARLPGSQCPAGKW